MKYSIIIPVYNGEKYIDDCLTSVLSQTISDFEVIIVDDGSKDGSGRICDGYAEKDERIKVFHKKNGGVSSARNFGMEKACGEFITFVDCDDMVSPYLLEYAEKAGTDFDVIIYKHTRKSTNELCRCFEKSEMIPIERKQVSEKTIYDPGRGAGFVYNAVAKIYRSDIVADIRFFENIPIGEDKLFGFCVYQKAEKIYCCDRVMYFSRPNAGSIMHNYAAGYLNVAESTFEIYEKLTQTLEEKECYRSRMSLRAVVVTDNIVKLYLCHKKNPKSFSERKTEWKRIRSESLTGKYFSQCDGEGLSEIDRFYLWAYKHSFGRIELMTKFRYIKAVEYIIYKIQQNVFHR